MKDAYPSKYLASEDLGDNEATVKIKSIRMEKLNDRKTGEEVDKPILYFFGKEKGMVLNPSNWKRLQMAFGTDETDDYIGKSIIIYVDMTPLGPGLHVRGVKPAAKASGFNAEMKPPKWTPSKEYREQQAQAEGDSENPGAGMEEALNDEIPF